MKHLPCLRPLGKADLADDAGCDPGDGSLDLRDGGEKVMGEITYKQIKDLEKEKIALSAKPFTIEPLEATPLEKRIFCTHTPFDSDTHFQVLKAFESTFSSPPKLAKRRKKI